MYNSRGVECGAWGVTDRVTSITTALGVGFKG